METLIGVAAETRIWRHSFNEANVIPPEHPRVSTTDHVRRVLFQHNIIYYIKGLCWKDFILKQVKRYTCIIIT